jgi:hypothetical protein
MPHHHKIGTSAHHYFQDLGRRSYSGLRACCPVLHAITTHGHKRRASFRSQLLLRHFTDSLRKQPIDGSYSAPLTTFVSSYKNVRLQYKSCSVYELRRGNGRKKASGVASASWYLVLTTDNDLDIRNKRDAKERSGCRMSAVSSGP